MDDRSGRVTVRQDGKTAAPNSATPGSTGPDSGHVICSRIEQNFHSCGSTHLKVALVSPEDANPIRATVHDRSGLVVWSFEVDQTTGIIRDSISPPPSKHR